MDIGSAHARLGIDDRSVADELIINVYTFRVSSDSPASGQPVLIFFTAAGRS